MIQKYSLQLAFLSLLIVAFGQPFFPSFISVLAAAIAYAPIFLITQHRCRRERFWISAVWFSVVQLIQLSWIVSHPFLYIYPLYFIFATAIGVQFGLIAMLATSERLIQLPFIFALSSLWVIFEWGRLFVLSGYTWNPIGLALAENIFSMQIASLVGVYGLSFLVICTNLLAVRAYNVWKIRSLSLWLILALCPYIYGGIHYSYHQHQANKENSKLNAFLIHTAFPVENHQDKRGTVSNVFDQWTTILHALKTHKDKNVDLIVLPEYVVLCGTYTCVFPIEKVKALFKDILGMVDGFPPLEESFARTIVSGNDKVVLVNNAFWAQSLANFFKAGLVIGLEDAEDLPSGPREYFSSAQFFSPKSSYLPQRYDKRVLLPLGEFIPFAWCREFAARYGVYGSFTPGQSAKVFEINNKPFGLSICYEETFGHLTRENKLLGASFIVNLTSDAWYPDRLPYQHLAHAYLRSVENGIPLIRATNLGVTGAVDSLGRIINVLDTPKTEVLFVSVPLYGYATLYSRFGDYLIIFLCLAFLFVFAKKELFTTQSSQRRKEIAPL